MSQPTCSLNNSTIQSSSHSVTYSLTQSVSDSLTRFAPAINQASEGGIEAGSVGAHVRVGVLGVGVGVLGVGVGVGIGIGVGVGGGVGGGGGGVGGGEDGGGGRGGRMSRWISVLISCDFLRMSQLTFSCLAIPSGCLS